MTFTNQFKFIEKQPYFKQWLANLGVILPADLFSMSYNVSSIIDVFAWWHTDEGYGFWYRLNDIDELKTLISTSRQEIKNAASKYFSSKYPEYFI
jgi:hypothetical protein